MRLGTANIKNYPDMPEAKVVADARKMADLCDVWGQQENNPAEDSPAISRALGDAWAVSHTGTNLPIWYMPDVYEVEQTRRIYAPFDPVLPLCPRPRWITSAVLKLRDRGGVAPFAVINCHLIAGGYNGDNAPADTARRRRQWDIEFDELTGFVQSFRRRGLTVFVLGDFNHPRPPKPVGNFQWLVGARLDRIGVTTTGGTEADEKADGVVDLNSDHRGQWTRVLLS